MKRQYIRFGEIPEDERSGIYSHNESTGEKEIGVSVYDQLDGSPCIPFPITGTTLNTLECFILYTKQKIYLVEGDEVGRGTDNEPLIRNIRIIKEITNKFYENAKQEK